MTQIVHVANTNVEFEFAGAYLSNLEESLSQHPLCLQLQFLPLLYAQSDDIVAVTHLPKREYIANLQQRWPYKLPQLVHLQEVKPFLEKECLSWGPSRQVQTWTMARRMHYAIPQDWQVVSLVNSKAFSLRYTPLSEGALLYDEQELLDWLQKVKGPKVLKTCFGLSGQGNRQINENIPSPRILTFCRKEWQQGRPIIGEPWLDRLLDFSTQWLIHPHRNIEWIGATRFETDSHGTYQGTLAGTEEILFASLEIFLNEHRRIAQKALADIAAMGFFGHVGIDALLYRNAQTGSICLYPLVEINGRQTMSLVALRMQKLLCPNHVLRLRFLQNLSLPFSLLPDAITNSKGKTVIFQRRLTADILENPSELICSVNFDVDQ
jgi:hypothetical protein